MGSWTPIRDTLESAATLAGNYYLPGSSLLTDHLVSQGSQKQLGSTLGTIANIGSGFAGSGVGSSFTGIPSASDVGAGWTNAANGVGNLVGAGDVGTNVSNSLSGLLGSSGSGASGGVGLTGGGVSLPNSGTSISDLSGGYTAPSSSVAGNGFASLTSSPAASAGIGGGGSSYGGLGTLAQLGGAANSLYANNQAQKDLVNAQKNSLNAIAPYQASGAAANNKLSDFLGTGGTGATASDILSTSPGYQFTQQQGNQALDRKQAASGNYFSGASLKAASDYNTGLANQTANQYYGQLAQQAGQGQGAANTATNVFGNIGNAQAGAQINSANITNQALSGLLSGSGAKRPVNIGGQVYYM